MKLRLLAFTAIATLTLPYSNASAQSTYTGYTIPSCGFVDPSLASQASSATVYGCSVTGCSDGSFGSIEDLCDEVTNCDEEYYIYSFEEMCSQLDDYVENGCEGSFVDSYVSSVESIFDDVIGLTDDVKEAYERIQDDPLNPDPADEQIIISYGSDVESIITETGESSSSGLSVTCNAVPEEDDPEDEEDDGGDTSSNPDCFSTPSYEADACGPVSMTMVDLMISSMEVSCQAAGPAREACKKYVEKVEESCKHIDMVWQGVQRFNENDNVMDGEFLGSQKVNGPDLEYHQTMGQVINSGFVEIFKVTEEMEEYSKSVPDDPTEEEQEEVQVKMQSYMSDLDRMIDETSREARSFEERVSVIRSDCEGGGTPGGGGGGCFAADTDIMMENGEVKKIIDLKIGDRVLSFDSKAGKNSELVGQRVTHIFLLGEKKVYDLHGTRVTETHKFMTYGGDMVALGDMKPDDKIVLFDGGILERGELKPIGYESVYNVTVENTHSYIANNMRVGNMTVHPPLPEGVYTQNDLFKQASGRVVSK